MNDLTNQRFGRLVALERASNRGTRTRWLCRCDCGKTHVTETSLLTSGGTKSCGCLRIELGRKLGASSRRHGHCSDGKSTPEYTAWASMISRCSDPKVVTFKHYGGRGIRVCARWQTFENFLSDMGPRPSGQQGNRPAYSLDRHPDPNGNYEPGNCRWATWKEQNRNNRHNTHVVILETSKTIAEWSEVLGLTRERIKLLTQALGDINHRWLKTFEKAVRPRARE
jgi:hypothetical protein